MGKWLNADLREQGCAVWDIEFHTVHGCPIEVLLQTQSYHMWECLHMYSSARRAIYLFATIFFSPCNVRQYKSSSKTMTAFKGRT